MAIASEIDWDNLPVIDSDTPVGGTGEIDWDNLPVMDDAPAQPAANPPRMTREERIAANNRAIETARSQEDPGFLSVAGDALAEGAKGAARAVKSIGSGIVGMASGAVRLAGTPVRAVTGWEGLHRLADTIDSSYENFGADALMSEYGENPDGWGYALGRAGEKIAGVAGSLAALGGVGKAVGAAGTALKAAGHAKTAAAVANTLPMMFGNDAAVRAYDTARANGRSKTEAASLAGLNGAIHFLGFKAFENKALNKMLGMPAEMEGLMPKWAGEAAEAGGQSFSSLARGVRNGMIKYTLAERGKGALKAGGIMGLQDMLSDPVMQVVEGASIDDIDFSRMLKAGASGLGEGALMEGALGAASVLKSPSEARKFIADKIFRGKDYKVMGSDGRMHDEPGLLNTSEGRMVLMKQNPDATERVLDIVEHGGTPRPAELDAAFLPPDMTAEELKKFASDWRNDLKPYVDEAWAADAPRQTPAPDAAAAKPGRDMLSPEEAQSQQKAMNDAAEAKRVYDKAHGEVSIDDYNEWNDLYRRGVINMSFDEWLATKEQRESTPRLRAPTLEEVADDLARRAPEPDEPIKVSPLPERTPEDFVPADDEVRTSDAASTQAQSLRDQIQRRVESERQAEVGRKVQKELDNFSNAVKNHMDVFNNEAFGRENAELLQAVEDAIRKNNPQLVKEGLNKLKNKVRRFANRNALTPKTGGTDETGSVRDETPAQPEQAEVVAPATRAEARPVESAETRAEAADARVVESPAKPAEAAQKPVEAAAEPKVGEDTPAPAKPAEAASRVSGAKPVPDGKPRSDRDYLSKTADRLNYDEVIDTDTHSNSDMRAEYKARIGELTDEQARELADARRKERAADKKLKKLLKGNDGDAIDAADKEWDAAVVELQSVESKLKITESDLIDRIEAKKTTPQKPVPDGKGKMVKPKAAESDYGVTMLEEPAVDGEGVSYVVKDGPSDAHRMMFKSKAKAEARLDELRAERKAIQESPSATLADGTKVHLLKTDEGWVPYNENYVDLRRGLFKAAKTKAGAIKVAEKGVKWAKDVAEFNSAYKMFEEDFGLDEFNKKVGRGNENGEGWNESAALEHLRQFDLEKLKDMKERAKRFNLGHHNGRNEKIQEWFDKVISEKKAPVPDGKGKMVKPEPKSAEGAGAQPPTNIPNEKKSSAQESASPSATWTDRGGTTHKLDGFDPPSADNITKGRTVAIRHDNGVLYSGELVGIGPKNVKIKTQSDMYGEQVLTFPKADVVGVKSNRLRRADGTDPLAEKNPAPKTVRKAIDKISLAISNRTGTGAITPEEADGIVRGIVESPETKHNRYRDFFNPLENDAKWHESLGLDAESAKNIRDAVDRVKADADLKKWFPQVDAAVKKAKDGNLSKKDAAPLFGKISEGLEKAERMGLSETANRLREAAEVIRPVAETVEQGDVNKFNYSTKGKKLNNRLGGTDKRGGKTVSLDTKNGTVDVRADGKGSTLGGNRHFIIDGVNGDELTVTMKDAAGKTLATRKMNRAQWSALANGAVATDGDPANPQKGDLIRMSRSDESPAERDLRFASDENYQKWLKSRKANDAEPLRERYEQEQAKAAKSIAKNTLPGVDVEIVDRAFNPETDGGVGKETRAMVITDPAEIAELEKDPVSRLRSMQLQDGKLYPPMAGKVKQPGARKAEWVNPTELGDWQRADERPDIAFLDKKTGNWKFKLDKGNGESVVALYNPYWHTTSSPLNDQFSSAYKRPELVTVETLVPRAEAEGRTGYKAEKAADAEGEKSWHSGTVSAQLKEAGLPERTVTLSRHNKVVRIVPTAEVADRITAQIREAAAKGVQVEIPFNTLTPQLRDALHARGVKIGEVRGLSSGALSAANKAYNEWKTDTAKVRYLCDGEGRVVGTFDRSTNKVTLYRGASAATLVHELGGHATLRFAEQEAERGNRQLLDRINRTIDEAPQALKDEIRSRYPGVDETALRDEIWAALRERNSPAMEKAIKTLQGKAWYNRAWSAFRDAWKGLLARMGFNRADLSQIDKMSNDEFLSHLDRIMSDGKTLGRLEAMGEETRANPLAESQESVREARSPRPAGSRIMDDQQTKGEKFTEKFIDSLAPVKSVQDELGGVKEVTRADGYTDHTKSTDLVAAKDKANGRLEYEVRQHQFRVDDINRDLSRAALPKQSTEDLVDDFNLYLQCKHAPERNLSVAQDRGDTYTSDYSEGMGQITLPGGNRIGLSENVADRLLRGMRGKYGLKFKMFENAADKVYKMLEADLDRRFDAGRLSAEDYAFYKTRWHGPGGADGKWAHYVPLKTDMERLEPEALNSSTAGMKRNEFMKARGRGTGDIADSPLAAAVLQTEQGIRGSIRNEVANVEANLVEHAKKQGIPIAEIVPGDEIRRGRTYSFTFADGETVDASGSMRLVENHPEIHLFKRDGKLYAIRYDKGANGRGLAFARAASGENMGRWGQGTEWIPRMTHWMSAMRTQYSPEFTVSNWLADHLEAAQALVGRYGLKEGGKAFAKTVASEIQNWKDLRAYLKDGTASGYIKEFVEGGGLTKGGVASEGFDAETQKIRSKIEQFRRKQKQWREMSPADLAKSAGRHVVDFLSFANELAEYSTRTGLYTALRKQGVPQAEAIKFARDATVNFNRKGTAMPYINGLYMFANASVQGAVRSVQAMRDTHGKELVAALTAIGVAKAVIDNYLGNDDEREAAGGRNARNQSEYDKKHNVGVPIGDGRQIVPLRFRGPYAAVPYLAQTAANVAMGATSPEDGAKTLFRELGDQVTDLVGGNGIMNDRGELDGSLIGQSIAPSVADLIVQLATGKDYKGDERRQKSFDKTMPASSNGKRSTASGYKMLAKGVNYLTGGNELRKGLADFAPEDYQLVLEFLGGAPMRDINNVASSVNNAIQLASGGTPERTLSQIPFVRRVVREYPESTSRYYDALEEYERDKAEFKKTTSERRKEMKADKPYLFMGKSLLDGQIERIKELTHLERGEVKVGQKWVEPKTPRTEEQKEKYRKLRLEMQARVLKRLGE